MSKQRPSMRDVAEAANVSLSTVSLVLNRRPGISEETRELVTSTAAELGYEIQIQNQNGHKKAIGLLIEKSAMPALLDIFYGEIVRGIQTEAQRLGYQVMLHMFDRDVGGLRSIQSELTEHVQGMVIANDGDITADMIAELEQAEIPLVLIENYVSGHPLASVLGDNFTAGYTMMNHLLTLGHRKVALLRGPAKYSSLVDRMRGALAAIAEGGFLIPPEYMPEPLSGHPQKGYIQMKEILELSEKPTAVMAISDKTAFGAMDAIRERGLKIPDDIAIVSIDNVSESAYSRPPLTSFHIPRSEMGVLAMQKLHRIMKYADKELPVKSVVYGELIVRESC